jgi:hypothetical protein
MVSEARESHSRQQQILRRVFLIFKIAIAFKPKLVVEIIPHHLLL